MTLDVQTQIIIRVLIYPIQFDANPVDGIDRVIKQVVLPRLAGEPPTGYLAAITAALGSSEPLAALIPQGHSEAVIRHYLSAMRMRLETLA